MKALSDDLRPSDPPETIRHNPPVRRARHDRSDLVLLAVVVVMSGALLLWGMTRACKRIRCGQRNRRPLLVADRSW